MDNQTNKEGGTEKRRTDADKQAEIANGATRRLLTRGSSEFTLQDALKSEGKRAEKSHGAMDKRDSVIAYGKKSDASRGAAGEGNTSRAGRALEAAGSLGGRRTVDAQRRVGAASQQTAGGGLPKLGGVFWWLLLGLMIASDIGSIVCDLIIAGGTALTATAVGSVVGIPLAIVGWVGGVFLAFNAFMFSTGYYLLNNVPLMEARKLATMGVSAIIKLIPMVNLLPTLTISFIVVTIMENTKRKGGIVGKIAQTVTVRAGSMT